MLIVITFIVLLLNGYLIFTFATGTPVTIPIYIATPLTLIASGISLISNFVE